LLVLFTDGVSDARNRRGDILGEGRVLDTIRENRESDPATILDCVMQVVDEHTGRSTRRDDLTVVLVRA
jgi:sigma-B regulation protein RsbU (phosphoserine phosphatase)